MNIIKKNYQYILVGLILVIMIFYYNNKTSVESGTQSIYSNHVVNSNIDSNSYNYIYVDIKGEIFNPGVYKVKENSRIFDLIYLAGGAKPTADLLAINQSEILCDSMVIYIPHIDENNLIIYNNYISISEDVENGLININKATVEQLQEITGIGEATATSIVTYSMENGLFTSIEDIKKVSGIGDITFESIKEYITV